MPVQFIVDCFGIDHQEAVIAGKTEAEINALRLAIREHLIANKVELLRVRLPQLALQKHFKNFEGMAGVLPTQIIEPRAILAKKLKQPVPQWLCNEWIVQLHLLEKPSIEITNNAPFERSLILACHENLLIGTEFETFIAALLLQPVIFVELLKIQAIQSLLISHLNFDLNIPTESAEMFICELEKSDAIDTFLEHFAYEQHLALLRQKTREHSLSFALPAQTISTSLLNALPLLALPEEKARHLPADLVEILKVIARKILHKECDSCVLSEFLIADWQRVWQELAMLSEETTAKFFTPELQTACQRFNSPLAQAMQQKIEHYLAVSHYRYLSQTANVEEALDWGIGYFDYLKTVLLSKQPLDESINQSFTDWLLSQSSRIARSDSDWRFCAKQIQDYLNAGYLVVITVVDALSALNQDILLEKLASLTTLTLTQDMLFAPLPTLTEIGKLAVLTGKPTHLLPSNTENALQQTYQTSPIIIKSWDDENYDKPITEQTNLVVFFENRIDERLHTASSFERHREDIKPILNQLTDFIKNKLKDAAHRDVVFFITADHGMTVTNGRYDGAELGEIKDRIFKLKIRETALSEEFVLVSQDSKDAYAVPKTRLGLTNSVLAHGGLTPEEVLIPFIKLTRPTFEASKLPVDVEITGDCLLLGKNFWQLDVRVNTSVQIESVRLSLAAPFQLENFEPIDIIRAYKSPAQTLKFRADCEQEGLIALALTIQFERAGAREIISKTLPVNFPVSFITHDSNTQSFEDMF